MLNLPRVALAIRSGKILSVNDFLKHFAKTGGYGTASLRAVHIGRELPHSLPHAATSSRKERKQC